MNYQLGVIPVFPARVVAGVGIRIDRANAVYTISGDYNTVAAGAVTSPATTYVLVQQPGGLYAKVPVNALAFAAAAPASASAAGNAGQIAYDAGFLYVCTAANTWKRVAIATW